jgi:hypothetical protein
LLLDGMFTGNTDAAGFSGLLGAIIAAIGSLFFWALVAYCIAIVASTISQRLRGKDHIHAA